MKREDPKTGNLFDQTCAGPSVSDTLLEEWRAAELGLRGDTLLGRKRAQKGRYYDFIWIVYSVFFIIQPIQEHSRIRWIEFGIAYACFVALYTGMVIAAGRRIQLFLLLGLLALGILYYPINAGACGMFIYVAAFVPFVTESISLCIGTFVAVAGIMAAEGMLTHLSPWSWAFCAFFAIAVGSGNLLAAQRMRANKKLELANEQIAHLAKLAERERIARDLHDVLGHTLSVVVLKSELAGKLMDRDPARSRQEIGEVEQIARKALTEVREAIRGYRSEGLAAEILRAQKTLDAAGVALECDVKPPQLPPAEETVLSLIVREAVTNIVRHAQASRCRMDFSANGRGTALVVEDDGRGGIRQEGNGLRGMRERVESLGGRFRIESNRDGATSRGTRLVIEIPPQAAAEAGNLAG